MRWWVTRGWAFAAALLLAVPTVALSSPYPIGASGTPTQIGFASAAVAYLAVAVVPRWTVARSTAMALGTFVAGLRALTFVLDADANSSQRAVGAAAWLLAMLYLAMTPSLTERYVGGTDGWRRSS